MTDKFKKYANNQNFLQVNPDLMSLLLLHQTLVVPGNFHCQILLRLDQELHPRFTLLQEGLLLQQEGLEFAAENQLSKLICHFKAYPSHH